MSTSREMFSFNVYVVIIMYATSIDARSTGLCAVCEYGQKCRRGAKFNVNVTPKSGLNTLHTCEVS